MAYFSLIRKTAPAPTKRKRPASTSILTSGAKWPGVVKRWRISPPNDAATICGRQMVPLNNPR